VALVQAKAIITNHCLQPVYVWSVPNVGSAHTDNLPIHPGGRYEEPWRHGTSEHPGIAIKISTEADGIHKGMDEINFAYSIEHSDKSKVWVDLSPVRGKPFSDNLAFHTCHGMHQSADVQTGQCQATDNIELVLCSTARSSPAKDTLPSDKISECYDYHHNNDNYDSSDDDSAEEHPTMTTSHRLKSTGTPATSTSTKSHTVTSHPCPQCPPPTSTSTGPRHESYPVPFPWPYAPPHEHTTTTTTTKQTTVTKSAYGYTTTYYFPAEDHTEPFYSSPEHKTVTYQAPPKHVTLTYPSPPVYKTTTTYPTPPAYKSTTYPSPPVYKSTTYAFPPLYKSTIYSTPAVYKSITHPYPPVYKSTTYSSSPVYKSTTYLSPAVYKTVTYPAPSKHATVTYHEPPTYTTAPDQSVPHRPLYTHGDDNNEYNTPRLTLHGGDRSSRRSAGDCKKASCQTRIAKSHDYCKPKITYPRVPLRLTRLHLAAPSNDTQVAAHDLTTIARKALKQCVLPYCEPIMPGISCADAEKSLEAKDVGTVDWTDDEDVCVASKASQKNSQF
jgi:hypothetical protein